MAKKNNVTPANKLADVLGQLAKMGAAISEQKTKLWAKTAQVGEALRASDFDIFRLGEYEGSVYCVLRDGTQSFLIPFMRGEIDSEDIVVDDDNNIDAEASGLSDVDFHLYQVTALRDDDELDIKKGDTAFRMFVA